MTEDTEPDYPTINLMSLEGDHVLTGVEMGTAPEYVDKWNNDIPNTCLFVLDGVAYRVIEDPGDGYRSYMKDGVEVRSPAVVTNTFAPIPVRCKNGGRESKPYSQDRTQVLQFVDTRNGEVILEVGTDNSDDYYPWYVASWTPERIAQETK